MRHKPNGSNLSFFLVIFPEFAVKQIIFLASGFTSYGYHRKHQIIVSICDKTSHKSDSLRKNFFLRNNYPLLE